jgi:glycosyltransferase involved in cell wall biosynthesis
MGTCSFYRGQTAEASVAELRAQGYCVEYLDTALEQHELASLYAACDSLVHPYRGEGFALPVVEAMACGLPVIVTGAGPALDYADETTAYLIPARRGEFSECRVGEIETVGRPWLWEPDVETLVELLRRVVADREAARAKGRAASARIHSQFTWARSCEVVEARLRALVQGPEKVSTRISAGIGADAATRRDRATSAVIRDAAQRAKVSLTMIVRNEEANLPDCLESASGVFDEIVIVDTGSTDRTLEIAHSFGARVFDFVWVDDFAAARNAALARATGDYVFWLDADDRIEPPQRSKLKELLASLDRDDNQTAYVVRCSCDPDASGGGATVVDHIRLFPNREEVRWTYRVHEQILPSLRQAGVEVRWTDVTVRHVGYNDPALRKRKLERDSKILEAELDERPDDPFVLFNLGSIAIERQDGRAALDYLRRSLQGSAPSDSITRKLYALIARAHQILKDPHAALQVCAEGRAVFPDDAELLFREAVLRRHGGDRAGAEACWRQILTLKRPDKFSSVDMGIYGQLTRRNLAVLAEERGDRTEAAQLWAGVLTECPGDLEATQSHARLSGLIASAGEPGPSEEARP